MDKIKSNLKGLIAATVALLFFAMVMFLPWMYAGTSVSSNMPGYMNQDLSEGISGYELLDTNFFDVDAGFLVFIFQLLLLLVAIGMLAMSVFMILKGFFGIEVGPINKIIDKFGCWVHLGFGGLTVLVLIAGIIVTLCNGDSKTLNLGSYFVSMTAGFSLGWGIFVAVLFNAGSWAAVFVLEKMGIIGDDVAVAGPKVSYVCSKCGAKAAKGAAFCNQCGGKVDEVVTLPVVYACSQCGAPSKAGVAFCNQCGGKIEANTPAPVPAPAPAPAPANVCSQCGAQLRPGAAFCNQCGNKIG